MNYLGMKERRKFMILEEEEYPDVEIISFSYRVTNKEDYATTNDIEVLDVKALIKADKGATFGYELVDKSIKDFRSYLRKIQVPGHYIHSMMWKMRVRAFQDLAEMEGIDLNVIEEDRDRVNDGSYGEQVRIR